MENFSGSNIRIRPLGRTNSAGRESRLRNATKPDDTNVPRELSHAQASSSGLEHGMGSNSTPVTWLATWSPKALLLYASFLISAVVYFYIRVTSTLNLGWYTWYGVVVLFFELMGSTAVMLYGLCIIRRQPKETSNGHSGPLRFNIQVLA